MKSINLITVMLLLMLCSCAAENLKLDYTNEYHNIQYTQQRTYIPEFKYTKVESLNVHELIQELSSSRSLHNLENIKVQWIDSDIFVDFYFTDKVAASDIQAAMDYFSRTIILEKPYPMVQDEISALIYEKDLQLKTLRVFISGNLFSQTTYDDSIEKGNKFFYFENHLMAFPFRTLESQRFAGINFQNIESVKSIDMYAALKPYTYIVSLAISNRNEESVGTVYAELLDRFSHNVQVLASENIKELIVNLSESNEIVFSKAFVLNEQGDVIQVDSVWK